nr:MAG TPA: hypothetical protein [Caudoviricetes sp.]
MGKLHIVIIQYSLILLIKLIILLSQKFLRDNLLVNMM